jgi:hypothetical protein
MRLLLIVAMILLIPATHAIANPLPSAYIGLYADAAGTGDEIYTDGLENVSVFVVLHVLDPSGYAGNFWFTAIPPACFNVLHTGESSSYMVVGSSQTAAWVMTPSFATGTHTLLAITFSVEGATPECCWFELQVEPGSDLSYSTEGLWVNPNDPRTCSAPVESTTWGAIKAMYR